jgi:hypothetical protein
MFAQPAKLVEQKVSAGGCLVIDEWSSLQTIILSLNILVENQSSQIDLSIEKSAVSQDFAECVKIPWTFAVWRIGPVCSEEMPQVIHPHSLPRLAAGQPSPLLQDVLKIL